MEQFLHKKNIKSITQDDIFCKSDQKIIKIHKKSELNSVRQEMTSSMMNYLTKHADFLARQEKTAEENKKNNTRNSTEILPPELFDITVGVGKSTASSQLMKRAQDWGIPAVILCPTHELADEHIAGCEKAGVTGIHHYFGRQTPEDCIDEKYICWIKKDADLSAENNHRASNSICKMCPHGQVAILMEDNPSQERLDAAQAFFIKEYGEQANEKIDFYSKKPCKFLYDGLKESLSKAWLVAPTSSFSDGMVNFRSQNEFGTPFEMQRLVIVDEKCDIANEVAVTANSVTIWCDQLNRIENNIRKYQEIITDQEQKTNNDYFLNLLPLLRRNFAKLISSIINRSEIDIVSILDLQQKFQGGISGTHRWEKITGRDNEYFIPLRALNMLAYNLRSKSFRIDSKTGNIVIYELNPLIEHGLKKGSTIFLDATANLLIKSLIEAVGGKTHYIRVEQNMNVERVVGHIYARGRVPGIKEKDGDELRVGGEGYRKSAKKYLNEFVKIGDELMAKNMLETAIITHKSYLKYAFQEEGLTETETQENFEKETGYKIGWFGRHDRGHNKFKNHNLAIIGMPILSTESIESAFGGVRASLLQMGIDCEDFNGELTSEDERKQNGGVPLPSQKHVKNWLIDEYAATIAQAIGRARAVNSDKKIQIELWGGLVNLDMDIALKRFGVEIKKIRQNEIHKFKETSLNFIDLAIEIAVQFKGSREISSREVRGALEYKKLSAENSEILTRLNFWQDKGIIEKKLSRWSKGSPVREEFSLKKELAIYEVMLWQKSFGYVECQDD